MTSASTKISSAASGTSSSRTGRGSRSRRPLSPAQREAADAARASKIAALHEQIGEQVEALTADPQWRAMLDAAAKFHLQPQQPAADRAAGRAAGHQPDPGRRVRHVEGAGPQRGQGVHRARGVASLRVHPQPSRHRHRTGHPSGRTRHHDSVGDGGGAGRRGRRPTGGAARVLRGFRVAHVFDISQTDGDPLPDIVPELLTGDAPAALWDALAAQVAAHGYTLTREDCGQANGLTDPAARTVRVRPDVADAQAVKTLAHELAHIECGHTAEGFDYRGCRGRAEAEAESVAYIVTAWAGLDASAYTVPYVAAWSAGDLDIVRAAAATVTAAAGRILDHLDGAEGTENPPGAGESAPPGGPAAQPEGARVLASA